MTQEDIIRLAREAGGTAYTNRHYEETAFAFGPEALKRFAKLVAAAERKYMIYASPHIWSTEAVKQERERLASEIEKMPFGDTAASFAAWIRSQQ
jgi:hypothetical protein